MSNAKRINDFLPGKKEKETVLIQAKIPAGLHTAVKEQIEEDKDCGIEMNWTELVTAACRAYLSERGRKQIP